MKVFLVFLFVLFSWKQCEAQKLFHVSVQVPETFITKKFSFSYDNGLRRTEINTAFKNGAFEFSGQFYSKFATLYLSYNINDSVSVSKNYFINELPARFFLKTISLIDDSLFLHFSVENAFGVSQTFFSKRRSQFSKDPINKMNQFMDENGNKVWQNDSLKQIFYKNLDAVNKSDIEFVKQNKDEYFAFWFFKTQIVTNTFIPKEVNVGAMENLLNIYNTTFSDIYDSTDEGKYIREFLANKIYFKKTGWLAIKKGHLVPDFKSKDIDGNVVMLSALKGKYILLDFWATWCGPCMASVPFIKKIRANYSPSILKIIGISSDYDYKNFLNAIKVNKMNWSHIYNNEKINNLFGIEAIPATYLIDKKGIIVYSSKEDSNEVLVDLLKRLNNSAVD